MERINQWLDWLGNQFWYLFCFVLGMIFYMIFGG